MYDNFYMFAVKSVGSYFYFPPLTNYLLSSKQL